MIKTTQSVLKNDNVFRFAFQYSMHIWKLVNVYHSVIVTIRYVSDEKGMSPQLNEFEYSSPENSMW